MGEGERKSRVWERDEVRESTGGKERGGVRESTGWGRWIESRRWEREEV